MVPTSAPFRSSSTLEPEGGSEQGAGISSSPSTVHPTGCAAERISELDFQGTWSIVLSYRDGDQFIQSKEEGERENVTLLWD